MGDFHTLLLVLLRLRNSVGVLFVDCLLLVPELASLITLDTMCALASLVPDR
jgi:hypothetical protein